MSSVGSSDSSSGPSSAYNTDDVNRKKREAAAAKENESELVKRHQKEIRRLTEEHYGEVENLKKSHENQMSDLRKASSKDVSARDHKYLQEVEDLRDLYKKQLRDQANESQRRDEATRKSDAGAFDHEKSTDENRLEHLNQTYAKDISERDSNYGESLKQGREAEQNAINDNHAKAEKFFDNEAQGLRDERNLKVGSLQKGYDDYRQSAEARLRNQDIKHMQDQERQSQDMLRAVTKERVAKADSEEYLREGFKEDLQKTRQKFIEEKEADRQAGDMAFGDVKSSVGDRIRNQITSLEQSKQDIQDANVRSEMKLKQAQQIEKNNMNEAYQKNLDFFNGQREEMLRNNNDRMHHAVNKVRNDMDKVAVDTNRHYKLESEEQNQIHRDAYQNIKNDFDVRSEQTKNMADRRVKDIYESTTDDKARMAEMVADNHIATQHSHQDDMKVLRLTADSDKQAATGYLEQRIQKQEMEHGERMDFIVRKYEKEIQGLKDQMVRERKVSEETLRRTIDELTRAQKLSMDQVASQNRDRLRQADVQHSDEIRSINKRNDEKFDTLMAHIKKT